MLDEQIISITKEFHKNWQKEFKPGESLVPFSGPYFDMDEIKAMLDVIKNQWWIVGEITEEFEKQFAPLLGKKYGIFVNSGSSANLLAAYATKLILKEKFNFKDIKNVNMMVLTSASCFPSTANPWIQFGFNVKFIDCKLKGNYNIELDKISEGWLEKNSVLTFAHVLGNMPDMNKIMKMVKKYDWILVEDCCDALGSKWENKYLGSFGKFATCSFFPAHHMSTMEGGFIACDTEKDYKLLRSLRDWGRSCVCSGKEQSTSEFGKCGRRHSDWLNIENDIDHRYVFNTIGFNLKATEIQAAIGLEQIKKLDYFKKIRRRNFNIINNCFKQYQQYFELPRKYQEVDINWFTYPVRVLSNDKFNRIDIIKFLESKRIQTRLLFTGNYLRHPALINNGFNPEDFPNSDIILKEVFMLGVSQVITEEMMQYVCKCINEFMEMHK